MFTLISRVVGGSALLCYTCKTR